MPAGDDLVGRLHDRVRLAFVEHAEAQIDLGGGAFDDGQSGDQFGRLLLGRDAEILQ
jgi:hypothetical protein